MFKSRISKSIGMLAILVGLSACTSNPPVPPQQLFTQFCIASETINTIVLNTPGIDPKVVVAAGAAQPVVESVCASGVVLTGTNLQSLLQDGVPLLNKVVASLPADTPNLATLKLGVELAPVIIPQIIADLPAPTAPPIQK